MSHSEILRTLLDRGLIAIIRASAADRIVDLTAVLREAGISAFEITLTTPNALELIGQVRTRLGSDVILGAGTVLDGSLAAAAIQAGAEFLVSPTFHPEMVATARRFGKVSIPGAFTPTEIMTAWEAGADIVKVFPAEVATPTFFRCTLRPLPQLRLIPTGNIDPASAVDFLKAGACAIGIGGGLSDAQALATGQFDGVAKLAREYVQIVRPHREGR